MTDEDKYVEALVAIETITDFSNIAAKVLYNMLGYAPDFLKEAAVGVLTELEYARLVQYLDGWREYGA